EGFAELNPVNTRRRDKNTDAVYRQETCGEQNAIAQFGNFADVPESRCHVTASSVSDQPLTCMGCRGSTCATRQNTSVVLSANPRSAPRRSRSSQRLKNGLCALCELCGKNSA